MKSSDLITEARELCEKATPGPWMWDANSHCKEISLHSSRWPMNIVMNFVRYGMGGAAPRFNVDGIMERADTLLKSYPGKEHHHGFDDYIDHPDAAFIARSRTLIPELCDALEKAEAEIEKMKPFYTIADDTFRHWENAAYAMRDDERKKHRWIPVTERLPEIDVAVLVLHTYQRDEYSPITIGRLYQPCDKRRKPYWTFVSIQASDGAVYNDGTDFICPGSEYVTHWRPLPAPPEEGAEK